MGTIVEFGSTAMLLQREDFGPAYKALRKVALRSSTHDPARVADAEDLLGLLDALDLVVTLDDHGDLVGLVYGGDKPPEGAPDDFPEPLVLALAKLLRDSRFERFVEGSTTSVRTSIDRGVVRTQTISRSLRRFQQLTAPPRLCVGQRADIVVRYVSSAAVTTSEPALSFRASDGGEPLVVRASRDLVQPGDEVVVGVEVPVGRPVYRAEAISAGLYGDGAATVRGHAELSLDPSAPTDRPAEVLDAGVDGASGELVGARAAPHALEALRRFARRVRRRDARSVAERIEGSPDLAGALTAAGFSVQAEGAAVRAIAWDAPAAPWLEAELFDLVRAFAPHTSAVGLELWRTLRDDPSLRVCFAFARGRVTRLLRAREG